ncbi:MAG: hypothetical protein JXA79_11610 [Deltaproteobacteria bacterium]|nr:hypothetical protein [Deltaproteobacteria bacterium]
MRAKYYVAPGLEGLAEINSTIMSGYLQINRRILEKEQCGKNVHGTDKITGKEALEPLTP